MITNKRNFVNNGSSTSSLKFSAENAEKSLQSFNHGKKRRDVKSELRWIGEGETWVGGCLNHEALRINLKQAGEKFRPQKFQEGTNKDIRRRSMRGALRFVISSDLKAFCELSA